MGPLEIKFLVMSGILIGLKQANAFTCYDCGGLLEQECYDPFNATGVYTETCDGYCYKLKPATSNASAAVRGCKCIVDANLKSCEEGRIGGIVGKLCYCKGNFCNYAPLVGSSIIVTAAAMIVNIAVR